MNNNQNNNELTNYANYVWNDSLSTNGEIVDKKIKQSVGNVDDIDFFVKMTSTTPHQSNQTNTITNPPQPKPQKESIPNNLNQTSKVSPNKQYKTTPKRTKVKRHKHIIVNWKLLRRQIVALSLCSILAIGAITIEMLYTNPDYKDDLARIKLTATAMFHPEKVVNTEKYSHDKLNALCTKYDELASKVPTGEEYNYVTKEYKPSYNYQKIMNILKSASEIDSVNLRIATLSLAKVMDKDIAKRVLNDYLNELGYILFEDNRVPSKKTKVSFTEKYSSIDEYLASELTNIYNVILKDTEEKVLEGAIYVDENGNIKEIGYEDISSINKQKSAYNPTYLEEESLESTNNLTHTGRRI